jgi:GMP synthase-like glutamine amidotransferase
MRVRIFQHVPFEGIGSIGAWCERRGIRPAMTRLFAGDLPPSRPDYDLLVVMGGPMSVNDRDRFPWLVPEGEAVARGAAAGGPVLGICLGAQVIAAALGARVMANPVKEIGWFPVHEAEATSADRGAGVRSIMPDHMTVFHWHGETFDLPTGARLLLSSPGCAHQAFSSGAGVLGLQFHLEMTVEGAAALAKNCPEDLAPGPWVQEEKQLTAEPALFMAANRVLDAVLDSLAAST